jgi:putative endopeptidase
MSTTTVHRIAAAALLAAAFALSSPTLAAAAPEAAGGAWTFDTSVSPCDDFYQYVCGVWKKENPLPADQPIWSRTVKMMLHNRETLERILEAASADDPRRTPAERQIGDFYAACMDEKGIESRGLAPLRPALDRIAALRTKRELAPLLAYLHTLGSNGLFALTAEQDFHDSTAVIASLGPGGMVFQNRDDYLKDDPRRAEKRKVYAAHVERMLALLGEPEAEAHLDAAAVLAIETELARAALDAASLRDPARRYHKMSRAELAALAPGFDWSAYFAALEAPSIAQVNVAQPDYLRGVDRVIAATELPSLRAYLRWHLLNTSASVLPAAFVDEQFGFFGRAILGMKQIQPRASRCAGATDRALGEVLGRVYVERNFSPAAKARTQEMVADIERALETDVASLPWLAPTTRTQAIGKLRRIARKIGYPDVWRDYSRLAIVRGDALGNLERSHAFELAHQLAKIGRPFDRGEWDTTPATVNASYDPLRNDVTFPAALLQPPSFDLGRNDAYNFAAVGFAIGHELTHSLDDEGRRFDGDGNLKDWWTPDDVREFERRSACFVDQYSGYTAVDDIHLDGRLTLGENVADNGGTRIALLALEARHQGEERPVDGLTLEQRFFVGRAQVSCDVRTPQFQRQVARNDPHSPNRYRINGVLSNMPEFQRAFHCPAGAPMVRKDPCRLW